MKRNPFISRLATSVAAVALTIGSTFTFSACSDDDEVDNSGKQPAVRLEAPVVAETPAENITENSLQLSWAAVKDATSYSAQIRLSEAGDIFRETITETTQVKFEGLDDGTKFYFRVRANYKYDESRNSAYSDWTEVETVKADPTKPTLDTPANPMCDMSKSTTTSLTFVWESVELATKYNVVLTSIGKDDVTAMTAGTSYTFMGLEKGTKYYFTVQAAEIEGYNASKFSGVISAVTVAQLETPANLKCTVKMAEAAQFSWDAVENAADYKYEFAQIVSGSESIVQEGVLSEIDPSEIVPGKTISASANGTTVTFRGLERDTYYSFRVKAVPSGDAFIESEFTDYEVIKTLVTDATPLATPVISLDEVQQLKVMISWAPVANAYGYDYQIAPTDVEITSANEKAYTVELRPTIDETTKEILEPCPTSVTISKVGVKEAAVALEPATAYKVRLMAIADPEKKTDSNSQWTEWLDVTTAELADALTISTAEELEEVFGRMKDGGVVTLKAGNYFTDETIKLTQGITLQGESATDRPHVNMKQITLGVAACAKVRFANIVFTGYKLNGDGTLDESNLAGLGGYFMDNSGQTGNVESLEIENCIVYGGFKSAFIRMNRTNFGATNLTIKDNIVSVGGSDGQIINAKDKTFGKSWTLTGNTFDQIGRADYGNTKFGEMIRTPDAATDPDFTLTISNNTFYNISCIKGKNLFLSKKGTANVTKNIVTIDPSITWTSNIGISATLNSSDNFIFDTTSTLEGFTNVDPGFTGYVFLENYKPANADVIAAGAGDPRWLK